MTRTKPTIHDAMELQVEGDIAPAEIIYLALLKKSRQP